MIKHIVMFKIKASDDVEKETRVLKLKSMLDLLKSKIEEIIYLETGINISKRNVAFDLILITHFANANDLQTYINHPEHQEVIKYIDTVREAAYVVDYEF